MRTGIIAFSHQTALENPPKNTTLFHMSLDPKLLDSLVCPVTKGPLIYDKIAEELISNSAGLAYPIREGIAIMLPSEARSLAK